MRKRERENPCGVCGHFHRYEAGEVCGICGHRIPSPDDKPIQHASAFPTEILKDFLYLGSYDNASRGELLKTLGISRILNSTELQRAFCPTSVDGHIKCSTDFDLTTFELANKYLKCGEYCQIAGVQHTPADNWKECSLKIDP